jgi:beta-lactamase class A
MASFLLSLLLASPSPAACGLDRTFEGIAPSLGSGGRLGVAAEVLETHERAGYGASGHYPMQSVYKFPIAMAMLALVDAGTHSLAEAVDIRPSDLVPKSFYSPIRDAHPDGVRMSLEEILRAAVVESDGTASDVLLRLLGGPEKAAAYLAKIGVSGVTIATSEATMAEGHDVQYRNWASPEGAVRLLAEFQKGTGLTPGSRTFLLGLLVETKPGVHRLKGRLPEATPVAHKTGTSGTTGGVTAATNDIGIITLPSGRHLAIAVFVTDAPADLDAREAAIARAAEAAFACWQ